MASVKLSNGTDEVLVIFEGQCDLQIDNSVYEFHESRAGIKVKVTDPITVSVGSSADFSAPEFNEIEILEEPPLTPEDDDEGLILRTCRHCNGRYYCITNGCANTPCGWICD